MEINTSFNLGYGKNIKFQNLCQYVRKCEFFPQKYFKNHKNYFIVKSLIMKKIRINTRFTWEEYRNPKIHFNM